MYSWIVHHGQKLDTERRNVFRQPGLRVHKGGAEVVSTASALKLGLIGDNIAASQAPRLHQIAGTLTGIDVSYDRLIPLEMGCDFDTVFATCRQKGYRGVNITLPYKEKAAKKVQISDPMVAAIGAVNTVLFEDSGPVGLNTDYTGFIAAYRTLRERSTPGTCCLIGTGGVGRAVAFGLAALGAQEIRLVDLDINKAEALGQELSQTYQTTRIVCSTDAAACAKDAQGILNGTPIGMVGYGGTPLPAEAIIGAEWAFDAVYTPQETQFLKDAETAGLMILSGYELFFYQGVHAWHHFSGTSVDETTLRTQLLAGQIHH